VGISVSIALLRASEPLLCLHKFVIPGSSQSGINRIDFAKGAGTADVYLDGGSGVIAIGAGVSAQDVYLQANNNNGNLTVLIRGDTTDMITVHNDLTTNAWGSRTRAPRPRP
jgi:hypothetical protein